MLAGGSFGRRAQTTSHFAAELAARRQGDRAGAPGQADLDPRGRSARRLLPAAVRASHCAARWRAARSSAWSNTVVGQSFMKGSPFEGFMIKDGIDATSVEGAQRDSLRDRELPLRPAHHRCRRADAVVAVGRAHAYRLRGRVLHRRAAAGRGQGPGRGPPRLMGKHPRAASVLRAVAELASGTGPVRSTVARAASRWSKASTPSLRRSPRSRSGERRRSARAQGLVRGRLRRCGQSRRDPRADGRRHRLRPRHMRCLPK